MATTTDYTITRPIMSAEELDRHRVKTYGRIGCGDGYDDMEIASGKGWISLSCWGADGWDLGSWPYVSFQVRQHEGRFMLQQIVEGDHTQWEFATREDLDAAIDFEFLWHAAGEDWCPVTYEQRADLCAGRLTVDDRFRGPYRA